MNKLSDNKSWVAIGGVAILAVWMLFASPQGTPGTPGSPGSPGQNLGRGEATNVDCTGGVCTYSFSQTMAMGTTTANCKFTTPAATTTLISLVAATTESTSTTMFFAHYQSGSSNPVGAFATTTGLLGQIERVVGSKFELNASNTPQSIKTGAATYAGVADGVFAPSSLVIVGNSGVSNTATGPIGTCKLRLQATSP